MKRMKKIMAVLLAAIMTMAMAVTAFAADETGTLTIKVKDGQTLAGQTVNIYKLFDVTVRDDNGNDYAVNAKYKDILKSVLGSNLTSDTDAGYYQAVLKATDTTEDSTKVQTFANDFTKELLKAKTKVDAEAKKTFAKDSTDTEFTIDSLAYGYYLVCQTGTKTIQSSLVLLAKDSADVNLKSEAPDIKKIADTKTVHVGQTVTYTITGQVPDMTGYVDENGTINYTYKIHDTLTEGLDFVTNEEGTKVAVTVKINGVVSNVTTAAFVDNDGNSSDTASKNMLLDLSEEVKNAVAGQSIEVTYQAIVNENAVVTTNNKATLEYSNNPGTTGTGETKPSEVVTPTYPLDINKTDTKNTMLAGAKFKLYASTENGEIDKNTVIKVTKGADGKYIYAKDQNSTDALDVMETVASGIDGNGYNLHVNGLAAGIYYIEETEAPTGYNKLSAPVKIEIKKSATENEDGWTITKGDSETPESDKIIDIENSTGSLLPSTGGKGAIAFGIVAAILVLGVVVSFMRDKRKAA